MYTDFQRFTYLCLIYMYFTLYTIFGIGIRFYFYLFGFQCITNIFLVWHGICIIWDVSRSLWVNRSFQVEYMIPEFRDSLSPSYMMLKAATETWCESAFQYVKIHGRSSFCTTLPTSGGQQQADVMGQIDSAAVNMVSQVTEWPYN